MKRITVHIVFLLIQISYVLGQTPKYFLKSYNLEGEQANTIVQLKDSSYIFAGNQWEIFDNIHFKSMAARIDKNGELIWERKYDYPDEVIESVFQSVLEINDSSFLCVGEKKNLDSTYSSDIVMINSSSGDVIWRTSVKNSYTDNSYSVSIKKNFNGGFIAVGPGLDSSGMYEASIISMDSLGNPLWDTLMGQNGHNEIFNDIEQTTDSGFAVMGGYDWGFDFGQAWYIKFDKNMKIKIDKKFNILNYTGVSNITKTSDNNYILCGGDKGVAAEYNIVVFKMDTLGNIKWYKIIKDYFNPIYISFAKRIHQLSDKGFIVAGSIYTGYAKAREAMLSRLDPNGNELWRRTYGIYTGQDDYAYDMVPTSDGGYVMTGRAETPTDVDVLLVKTNCDGFTGPPKAAFQKSITYNEVHFTNRSDSAVKYKWFFGDGDSLRYNYDKSWKDIWGLYDLDTFTYIYQDSGTYILKLIAYACDESDTLIDTLHVSLPVGIDKSKSYSNVSVPFTIFSVPGGNELMVNTLNGADFHTAELRVHDVTGRMVRKYMLSGNSGTYFLSTEGLKQGVYVFGLYRNGRFAGARKGVVW